VTSYDKITGCCITTHRLTLPFSQGNFWPKTTWLPSPPTLFFSASLIEEKLKDRHFDRIEVIEAELREVLNTLTEHDILSLSAYQVLVCFLLALSL
jgi:hypothetical protein